MNIERIIQIHSGNYDSLKYGYCLQSKDNNNTKYFDVRTRTSKLSHGWSKESFINLCLSFRLEFIS